MNDDVHRATKKLHRVIFAIGLTLSNCLY